MVKGIAPKTYYALLEWKDVNMTEWMYKSTHVYGVERMCDMSLEALKHLADSVEIKFECI